MSQQPVVSRRQALQTFASFIALATPSFSRALVDEPRSPLARSVVRAPMNTYSTYPHSNAFLRDGTCVLASPRSRSEISYLSFDLNTGASSTITTVSDARMYFAVSETGQLLFDTIHGVNIVDLTKPDQKPRQIFTDSGIFSLDCEISRDGKKALVTQKYPGSNKDSSEKKSIYRVDLIDVETGKWKTIMTTDWVSDHAHFSPYDPEWICFSCGDPKLYQRMWVWHPTLAPKGRQIFNQLKSDGTKFDIGHERAMFSEPALVVIAYGSQSDAQPCGLYKVGFDGSVKLISESNRDFHCDVSRDGRWAVVSLQGTHDSLQDRPVGNWRSHAAGYGYSDVMLVNMKSGKRQFLYRATNSAKGQPYEVQPVISPDGRWVVLKDAREQRVIGVEVNKSALEQFLR